MCSRIVKACRPLVVAFGIVACADSSQPPASGGVDLLGMYTYMADAAVFEDCETTQRFPVLIEAAHLEVERAYLEMREAPGAPLLLSARFEVVERAPEPGMPIREHLRVISFDRFRPDEDCPP